MGNILKSSLSFGEYCKSKELEFKTRLEYLTWYEKSRTLFDEFLKRPLELWMFVPCDENGNFLKEPNENDYNLGDIHSGYLHQKKEEYKKALSKVLFEGFDVIGYEEGYCQIELKNADFWITFTDGNIEIENSFSQEYNVHVIENLIQEDLTLTNNALKIWE